MCFLLVESFYSATQPLSVGNGESTARLLLDEAAQLRRRLWVPFCMACGCLFSFETAPRRDWGFFVGKFVFQQILSREREE